MQREKKKGNYGGKVPSMWIDEDESNVGGENAKTIGEKHGEKEQKQEQQEKREKRGKRDEDKKNSPNKKRK